MKYDVSNHIPTQIELMLVSFQKADVAGLERALDNMRNIVKDKRFHAALDDYNKERIDKINALNTKALDAAKTIVSAKNFSELYIDVEEIKNDLVSTLDGIEKDYWNHVKDYITLYINQEPVDVDTVVDELDDGGK
jgi:hypothetical protein